MLKRYLLSSVAFAPPGEGAAGDTPEDERIEVAADDDETVTDPVEGAEGDEADGEGEPDGEGDDAEGAGDGEPDGDEPPAAARGNRQMGELRAERRRLAEENAALTRQLDEVRRQPVHQQPTETPQARADRLALMSPEERIREEVQESLARNERNTATMVAQLRDQSDRNDFNAEIERSPLAKKFAGRVEQELANIRTRGQDLPRKVILAQLVGLQVLSQKGKPNPARNERQRQQQSRPANGRGDVPADRGARRGTGTVEDIERRFGDVPI